MSLQVSVKLLNENSVFLYQYRFFSSEAKNY